MSFIKDNDGVFAEVFLHGPRDFGVQKIEVVEHYDVGVLDVVTGSIVRTADLLPPVGFHVVDAEHHVRVLGLKLLGVVSEVLVELAQKLILITQSLPFGSDPFRCPLAALRIHLFC